MTEADLQAIEARKDVADYLEDVSRLIAEVRFMRQLIADLCEESSAYRRGVEDGRWLGPPFPAPGCINMALKYWPPMTQVLQDQP